MALLAVLLSPGYAAAQTTAAATAPAGTQPTTDRGGKLVLRGEGNRSLPALDDGDGILGQMVSYVLVILVLGGAAAWAARRFLPRSRPQDEGGRIRVTDTLHLSPGKQLQVIEVGGQRFLIASCKDGVSLVSELKASFAGIYEQTRADGGDAPSGEGDAEGRA